MLVCHALDTADLEIAMPYEVQGPLSSWQLVHITTGQTYSEYPECVLVTCILFTPSEFVSVFIWRCYWIM